jgi:hypothetical protein
MSMPREKNTIKHRKSIQLPQKKNKSLQDDKDREHREAVMHLNVDVTNPPGDRS